MGKTTIASQFPRTLLVAAEKGYLALPGVMAQPVNSWSDFLKVCTQLDTAEAKEMFSTVVLDTADILYEYSESYICMTNGVDTIGDIAFGKGYTLLAKEFDTKLRKIVQMGYGLVLISHAQDKVYTDENGEEYSRITPTLAKKARLIVTRMADIIGYSRVIETENGNETYLFMRDTPRYEAGSRFKYTPDKIKFNYENLVEAISSAIDKQALENDGKYVTDEQEQGHIDSSEELNFEEVITEAKGVIGKLIEKDADQYGPKIADIVEKHLGKGNKLSDCTRGQAMLVDVILTELKSL